MKATGQNKCLLFVRIGKVPEGIASEWNHWYDTVHIPNRTVLPGFHSARRFGSIFGESGYLTLYELAGVEALESEAYLALRRREASQPQGAFESLTARLEGFSRLVYEQIGPAGKGYQVPDTGFLFAAGHDVPANREDEFNAWYDTEHLPAMINRGPGFATGRRFVNVGSRLPPESGAVSSTPKYLTLYDLERDDVLQTETFLRETSSPWSSWVRSWYMRRFRILARRIYPKP